MIWQHEEEDGKIFLALISKEFDIDIMPFAKNLHEVKGINAFSCYDVYTKEHNLFNG